MTELSGFLTMHENDTIFLIKGYAGTGKTTIVNSIVKTLAEGGNKSVLLAPTGRAAKILIEYTGKAAYTIHKKIYRQKSGKDGPGEFVLDRNLHKSTLFIVDEASMIGDKTLENNIFGSGDLMKDLIEYVYSGMNCRLILIGDPAQLPPVGLELSPALMPDKIQEFGFKVKEFFLTDIVRQSSGSGILEQATWIRENINLRNISGPVLREIDSADVIRISGSEILEELEKCYSTYSQDETVVISRSNARANRFNKGIRNQLLFREDEITQGDMLMVVRNNYLYNSPETGLEFIANGDIARLEKIHRFESVHGYSFADVILSMVDYDNQRIEVKLLLDTLHLDSASLGMNGQRALFNLVLEEYNHIRNKRQRIRKAREDPYLNALQVKFGYAVTCHKAQGGQWKAVFIDIGYFKTDMLDIEYLRWLYTAFTRAAEKLYLVNCPQDLFR
jgi:exodeoxyribonuclease-5